MAGRSMMTVAVALLVLGLIGIATGQRYGPGICPRYQTSDDFTAAKIGSIVGSEGYLVKYAIGTAGESSHTCMTLNLFHGSTFSYTHGDGSTEVTTYTGTYRTKPSTYTAPGYIQLTIGRPGILGSDAFGTVRLYPLILTEDVSLYISCTSYALFHAEHVYAFVKNNAQQTRVPAKLKQALVEKGIPHAEDLVEKSAACQVAQTPVVEAGPARTRSSITGAVVAPPAVVNTHGHTHYVLLPPVVNHFV